MVLTLADLPEPDFGRPELECSTERQQICQ